MGHLGLSRFLFGRQRALEQAVRSRTEELERERRRERSMNHVLMALVSNQPLDEVLNAIAHLLDDYIHGAHAAILLRDNDSNQRLAAAPHVRPAWLKALVEPHAIPFELWKEACSARNPLSDPAWNQFAEAVTGELPLTIQSIRLGVADAPSGLILSIHSEPVIAGEVASSLESAARLAQLAIEHSRFYEELHFRAHHDAMTTLPNRAELLRRLDRELTTAGENGQRFAVLFIDLDGFKQINDGYSHRFGDLLLCAVAARMKNVLPAGAMVARIGGDEFNVLLPGISSPADADIVATRLLAAVRQPFTAEGRTVAATASAGIALFPRDGATADRLLTRADAALYRAKQGGRNKAVAFSILHSPPGGADLALDQLRRALDEGRFELHYQPRVTADGRLAGLEALVRLQDAEGGLVAPSVFIPVAEQNGLIVPLGQWVINEVCSQMARWGEQGFAGVAVAVNASPAELDRSDFAATLEASLARCGILPQSIEIELTEQSVIAGGGETLRKIRALRALGVRIAIHNFGAGHSSLGYLRQLPVDAIKLDRSFVQTLETNHAARGTAAGLISTARSLGLAVVAEGVETSAQHSALLVAGCPQMQGYFFARPRPAGELFDLIRYSASTESPVFAPFALRATEGSAWMEDIAALV